MHPALPLALAIGWAAAFAGCAAPGEPTPRHPVVPQIVQDLAAQQRGDAVALTFTLPRESTEKEPLAAPPTIEIYREAPPATSNAAPVRPVDTLPGGSVASYEKNGHIEFRDPLPPADLTDVTGRQIRYWVRTRVSARRASADSNAVTVRVYPAPGAVADLRAEVTETAIDLTWMPPNGTANGGYRVYRAQVEAGSAVAPPADASQAKLSAPLALLGQGPATEYRDTTFEFGRAYVYLVRNVAQFGSDTVESADSAPLLVAAKDVFPPAAPQDVAAVVSPATPEGSAYIEVTWAIGTEADLAGYVVYRSEQPDAPGQRLTSDLLLSPTFRDTSVALGRRYFYRVAAVDRAGNQSALSSAVAADIP